MREAAGAATASVTVAEASFQGGAGAGFAPITGGGDLCERASRKQDTSLKSLLANPVLQALLGRVMGYYMRLVGVTTRWRWIDRAVVEGVWAQGGPVIACIWHGRILLVHEGWFGPGAQTPKMLISQSREGGVVATASRMVGADVIRGSKAKGAKRKGGFEAMRAMLRHLGDGGCMCLTPDGPRGPRMRAQIGPVQLAKLAQAPIVCLAWSTSRRKVFGSWDRFVLPMPFGRGVFVWGGVIAPPGPDAGPDAMEAARAQIEAEMNRIARIADEEMGHAPILPADPKPAPATEPEEALA
jgi:hypothetical protein